MAKQRKGKRAEKTARKKVRGKEAEKTAETESTAHKPTDDIAKARSKPKSKPKSKPEPKPKDEIPSEIEHLFEKTEKTKTDEPADSSKEVSVNRSETEIPIGKLEESQKAGQAGGVTDETLDVTTEAERPADEVENSQTDDQTDEITEAILEAAAETERLAEEVENIQNADEQKGIVVESVDSDTLESLSRETEETQTDKSVEDVPDSAAAEDITEKIDDARTDDQPEEVIEAAAEETVNGYSAAESQTVVDRIKMLFSSIFRIGSKADDSPEEGMESHAETESFTEGTDDALTDKQVGEADDEVVESHDTVADHTRKADSTRTENQAISTTEANVEGSDDEIKTIVYSDNNPYRTKKTGIIISVFIVIAAVVLLIVASIERRSAKHDLIQISKVAESIMQMQEEMLKDREQVTHFQIESRELVIDALSLTRNGLELERANSDEVEVKRIIGVFINDIDERITKIKGNIVLLRNKLKEDD